MICRFKVIHYYLQSYLKILETNVLKYMNLILLIFYQHLKQTCLKKTKVKLYLLTDANMLLMVEKGVRGGICHAIH